MLDSLIGAVRAAGTVVGPRLNFGTNVFDYDWNLLIVLDSLRADALRTFTLDYDWLEDIEVRWSTGGASAEWIANTYTRDVFPADERVGLVTANPFYDMFADGECDHESINRIRRWGEPETVELGQFDPFVDVSDHTFEHVDGNVHHAPQTVTDRAISIGRENPPERLILHYMQPHRPFVGGAIREGRPCEEWETQPWGYIQRTGDRERVWRAYLDTVEWVLDDVERLLNNFDGKALITADHGEAIGEFTAYEHHVGSLHPQIRRVPWMWATGTDKETCTVDIESNEIHSVDLDERLKLLGYK